MRTLSISPSLLESWRVAVQDLYPNALESLIQNLSGVRVPNEAMSRGTAWHAMLDEGPDKFWDFGTKSYRVLEPEMKITWDFKPEAVEPLKVVRESIQWAAREVWHDSFLGVIAGYKVYMKMRYDALMGLEVHEFKTKSRKPTYQEYFKSVQWKCYLDGIPELQKVVYHIFQLNTKNDKCDYTRLDFNREDFDRMEINRLATGLVEWISVQEGYIERLERKAQRSQN